MSRKIKDIRDIATNELVYPRTHTKAVMIDTTKSLDDHLKELAPLTYVNEQIGNINLLLDEINGEEV